MQNGFSIGWPDYIAFFSYFILLSTIGYWFGRSKKEATADYFLAGQSLPWYVVGSSYIAANISTEHFIGLIGAAVLYGICVATGEWSTVIAFSFLIWLFIPYLLTSKVLTTPEFLEKRFDSRLRLLFAAVSVLANIFAFMGPVIYGGSLILSEFFQMNPIWACIIIGITTGGWAIWGGLRSVAFMDLLTILIMIFGGLSVTVAGLYHLGNGAGWQAGFQNMMEANQGNAGWAKEWISENVPNILKGTTAGEDYNRLSVLQPLNHYSNPWTHWVFSFFYIGLWYTVINQTMIQKVLAARDMYHARAGMVLAAFLKLLLPVIVVLPGLIFFAMRPDFLEGNTWAVMSDEANKTYIVLINQLLPPFLKGILLAALFGAIQSTVSSVLNSTSTLFTVDIFARYRQPDAGSAQLIRTGKVSGAVFLGLSIGFAMLLATVTKVNLFILIQALYTFIAPPFSAIFLLGMLWKRVGATDAWRTVLISFGVAGFLKYLEFGPLADSSSDLANMVKPFANQALITWLFAMIFCSISTLFTSAPSPDKVTSDLTFNIRGAALREGLGDRWWRHIGFWWGISILLLVILILIFSVYFTGN